MEDLSADDDILSDILLDNLEFEPAISTHKMNPQYRGQRFDRNTVSLIVRKRVVVEKDITAAIDDICKLGIVRKYLTNKTQRQIASFHAHARRYLESYLPDSGVEFALTTRYKRVMMERLAKMSKSSDLDQETKQETDSSIPNEIGDSKGKGKAKGRPSLDRASASIGAAPAASEKADLSVLAMRAFKVGEMINYCKGGLKDLSKSEDDALREEATTSRQECKNAEYKGVLGPGRDFSVIRSARKGCSQLLLGPARFLNHDCNPNTDFYRMGSTMLFKVIRPIQRNEEITTYYGDNYFEWANSECMCATCELRGTGAFSNQLPDIKPKIEEPSSSILSAVPETNGRQSSRRSVRPSGVAASLPSPSPTPSVTPSWSTTQGDDTPRDKKPKRELLADLKLAEHGPSDDRSDPWAEGAGPKCRCLTCGATFWAPEKWWTPDECPRCERHYKIFKADWPGRVPTEGLLARKPGLKQKSSSELISDHLASSSPRPVKQRSTTPTNASTSTPASQPKKRGRPPKAVSASPNIVSERASPKTGPTSSQRGHIATIPALESLAGAKGSSRQDSHDENAVMRCLISTEPNLPATATATDNYGLDSDGSDLTPEPDSDRDQVFEDDDEDVGPRPHIHAARSGEIEMARSTSSSPGPTGPKMLGKNAKTDVLAQYWGAPVGDRRARRKPSTTGGPELLGSRQSSQDAISKSAIRKSSFRESEGEGQHKAHPRRLIASSASDAEDDLLQNVTATPSAKHRKTPSMSSFESIQDHARLQKKASPQLQTTLSSPVSGLSPRSSADRPLSLARTHLADVDRTPARPSEGTLPELATSGTERTSESNLALFWSAGVGGPRQRRQAQQEPVNVTSPSMSGKRQRQTSESSRSHTPDTKRPRGGRPPSVGTDDDGSASDRIGRSRSVAFSEADGARSSRGGSDMDEDEEKPSARHQDSITKIQHLTEHDGAVGIEDRKGPLLPSASLFRPPGLARSDLAAAAARSSSPLAGPPRAGMPGQPMRKNLRWGSGKASFSRPLGPHNPQGSPLGRPPTSANGPASTAVPRLESKDVARSPPAQPSVPTVSIDKQQHSTPLQQRGIAVTASPGATFAWHPNHDQDSTEQVRPSTLPLEPMPVHDIQIEATPAMHSSESNISQAISSETVSNKAVPAVDTSESMISKPVSPGLLLAAPTAKQSETEQPESIKPQEKGLPDVISSVPVEEALEKELIGNGADSQNTGLLTASGADSPNRRSSGRARKAPEMAAGQISYKGSLVRLAAQRAKNPKTSGATSLGTSPTGTASPDTHHESPKTARYRKSVGDTGTPTKHLDPAESGPLPALRDLHAHTDKSMLLGNGSSGGAVGSNGETTSDMQLD